MRRNTLRTALRSRGRTQRRGFSLAELVIALGILLLMLSLAGQVMSLTVRSTGQATALTEINQRIRSLEQTLRDDLAAVKPGETVMVIAGNPINAYWTRDGKEADDDGDPLTGYPNNLGPIYQTTLNNTQSDPLIVPVPPRADMLMFFTTSSKAYKSAIQYDFGDPALNGQSPRAYVQQVVYGHAELGDWQPGTPGTGWVFEKRLPVANDFPAFPGSAQNDPSPSQIPPAQAWHLARRAVLMTSGEPLAPPPTPQWLACGDPFSADLLLEGRSDIYLLTQGCTFDFLVKTPCAILRPNDPVCVEPLYWPEIFAGGVNPFARSRLDADAPPIIQDDKLNYFPPPLGHYFLPNAASFKVEWTLDPAAALVAGGLARESEVLWIDPGNLGEKLDDPTDDNPLAALEEALDAASAASTNSVFEADRAAALDQLLNVRAFGANEPTGAYSLTNRFKEDPLWTGSNPYLAGSRINVHVFTASRGPNGEYPEEIFPRALRITVDLWDANGRLDRPVRHVMVIPIGDRD